MASAATTKDRQGRGRGSVAVADNSAGQKVDPAMQSLAAEIERMSHEHDRGDIDVAIPPEKFTGLYRRVAEDVNRMVAGHINVKKKAMACIAEFGKGNLDAPLEQFPGKKAFINENIERLRSNLKDFIAQMNRMSTKLCSSWSR